MRILFLLLFAPLVAASQSLTGYDFSCTTMEILDPVKYSDQYYVIEETREVDLKVSFYHNNIIIYDYVKETSNVMDVTFMQYDPEGQADIYSLESPNEPGSAVYVFYNEGMVNFCIEWIPEWDRFKTIYRLRDLTYIGHK